MIDQEDVFLKAMKVINEAGTNWKVKRALLYDLGLTKEAIEHLVPRDERSEG